jgi:hypothetical protein
MEREDEVVPLPRKCIPENIGVGGFRGNKSGTGNNFHISNHREQVEGRTCVWEFGCMGLGTCQLPNLAPVLTVLYSALC